jgi:thioredoxin 1
MGTDATLDTFSDLVGHGAVLVDFWGPQCAPCLALMPAVEALEARYDGRLAVVKVNAPENRQICRDLRVLGLPAYLLFSEGREVDRLVGDPTIDEIVAAVESVLGGET